MTWKLFLIYLSKFSLWKLIVVINGLRIAIRHEIWLFYLDINEIRESTFNGPLQF